MTTYIEDTKYAVESLFHLVHYEEKILIDKLPIFDSLTKKYGIFQRDFMQVDLNDDFPEIEQAQAFRRMSDAATERRKIELEVDALKASIATKEFAIQSLYGAILQIAKQGISSTYGRRVDDAREGRQIGSRVIRDIIWQGRNQAIHFEDNYSTFSTKLKDLFQDLTYEHGPVFDLQSRSGQSLAKEITQLLGWIDYQRYEDDMKALLL